MVIGIKVCSQEANSSRLLVIDRIFKLIKHIEDEWNESYYDRYNDDED